MLWDGGEAVGAKFGVTRVPTVKHQSMPAYDPRSVQGIGVTYATTPQGADHTAGYTITANILGVGGTVDPLSPEGQVDLSQEPADRDGHARLARAVHLRGVPGPRHPGRVRGHPRHAPGPHRAWSTTRPP